MQFVPSHVHCNLPVPGPHIQRARTEWLPQSHQHWVSLSCVFRTPYDFAYEHLVAELLLDFGTNRNRLKVSFERVPEKEKSMERP